MSGYSRGREGPAAEGGRSSFHLILLRIYCCFLVVSQTEGIPVPFSGFLRSHIVVSTDRSRKP